MKSLIACLVAGSLVALATPVSSHPGLTNKQGCHTENDGTNFHCHEDKKVVPEAEEPAAQPESDAEAALEVEKAEEQKKREEIVERWELEQLRREMLRRTKYQPTKHGQFDDDDAVAAFALSMGTIAVTSIIGGVLAADKFDGGFSTVALPSIGAGLLTSSIFSLQVGWGSDTAFAGGILVFGSALSPLAIGASLD